MKNLSKRRVAKLLAFVIFITTALGSLVMANAANTAYNPEFSVETLSQDNKPISMSFKDGEFSVTGPGIKIDPDAPVPTTSEASILIGKNGAQTSTFSNIIAALETQNPAANSGVTAPLVNIKGVTSSTWAVGTSGAAFFIRDNTQQVKGQVDLYVGTLTQSGSNTVLNKADAKLFYTINYKIVDTVVPPITVPENKEPAIDIYTKEDGTVVIKINKEVTKALEALGIKIGVPIGGIPTPEASKAGATKEVPVGASKEEKQKAEEDAALEIARAINAGVDKTGTASFSARAGEATLGEGVHAFVHQSGSTAYNAVKIGLVTSSTADIDATTLRPIPGKTAPAAIYTIKVEATEVAQVDEVTLAIDQNLTGGAIKVEKTDGTPLADGDKVTVGEKLKITATPNADKKLAAITVNGEDKSTTSPYVFDTTVLAANSPLTIGARFISKTVEATKVRINFESTVTGGKVGVTVNDTAISTGTDVVDGDKVVVTATADDGYVLESILIDGKQVATTSPFDMSSMIKDNLGKEITVSATFKTSGGGEDPTPDADTAVFTIKNPSNATITATVNGTEYTGTFEAKKGEEVKLTVKAKNSSFLVRTLSVDGENLTNLKTINNITKEASFSADDYLNKTVEITATTAKKDTGSSSSGGGGGGGGSSAGTTTTTTEATETTTSKSDGNNGNDGSNDNENLSPVEKKFSDVKGHWAKEYIAFVVDNGIFAGLTENQFGPNNTMTRGMLVTVLGRLDGADATGTSRFTDVNPSAYYAGYIAWASENKIVAGMTSDTFAPDSPVTREQLAVMIVNYLNYKGLGLGSYDDSNDTFADDALISPWAKDAVYALKKAGFLSGKGNNMFDPKATATRAEVAKIIADIVQATVEEETETTTAAETTTEETTSDAESTTEETTEAE